MMESWMNIKGLKILLDQMLSAFALDFFSYSICNPAASAQSNGPNVLFHRRIPSVRRVGYRQEDVYLPTSTMRMTFSHPKSIPVNAASADSAHMIYTCLSKCCPFSLLLMRHRSPAVSFVIHLSGFSKGWV